MHRFLCGFEKFLSFSSETLLNRFLSIIKYFVFSYRWNLHTIIVPISVTPTTEDLIAHKSPTGFLPEGSVQMFTCFISRVRPAPQLFYWQHGHTTLSQGQATLNEDQLTYSLRLAYNMTIHKVHSKLPVMCIYLSHDFIRLRKTLQVEILGEYAFLIRDGFKG